MRDLRATATFLALFMTVTSWTVAAAPQCFVSLSNPPEHIGSLPATLSNGDAHWLTWKCPPDAGIYFDTFKISDILPFVAKEQAGTFNKAEADAALAALPEPSDAESDSQYEAAKRRALVNYYGFTPLVVDGIAYKRTVSGKGPAVYTRYGKLPIGTKCQPDGPAGSYMRVDRNLVVKDSRWTATPDLAFAVCG